NRCVSIASAPCLYTTINFSTLKCIHFIKFGIQSNVIAYIGGINMNIGFIGLGIMGKPMVKNLLKANNTVLVNDVNKEAETELVKEGAQVVSIEEIAKQANYLVLAIIHVSVFNTDIHRQL